MGWMLTPVGIGILAVVIVGLTTVVYWKREPIKGWLRGLTVSEVELGIPPKFTLKRKEADDPQEPTTRPGVTFGEDGDFTGSSIQAAGRDIRRGSAAADSPEGEAPGVDFGRGGRFRDAEIEAAGRNIVEDNDEEEA